MNSIKKTELFTVPQLERATSLEKIGTQWMDDLKEGEKLVIGLPAVLGEWSTCTPLVVGPGMQQQFKQWVLANTNLIRGPLYNLPKLNAYFLCVVANEEFEPRREDVPPNATKELQGVLLALTRLIEEQELQTA